MSPLYLLYGMGFFSFMFFLRNAYEKFIRADPTMKEQMLELCYLLPVLVFLGYLWYSIEGDEKYSTDKLYLLGGVVSTGILATLRILQMLKFGKNIGSVTILYLIQSLLVCVFVVKQLDITSLNDIIGEGTEQIFNTWYQDRFICK